jgi:Holliday junction resolvase
MASKYQTKIIKRFENDGYLVINLIKTNKNGIPDLLALKDGEKPLFIECKEKTDTLKPLQKFRIEELKKYGVNAIVLQDKNNV